MHRVPGWWPIALGVAVFIVALWAQPGALVGTFYDDGIYVVLAKALATGEGYRNLHLPGAPPGVHYPILYPAVLSVLWRLWPAFPQNVVLFQLLDAAALAGAAAIVAAHARRTTLPAWLQMTALAVGFTAFPLLTLVGVRFSEPLFLLLAAAAVYWADGDRTPPSTAVAVGVAAGLATATRSIGVTVIAGAVLGLWLRGRRRAAWIAGAVSVATAAPWFVWTALRSGAIDPPIAANYGTYGAVVQQTGLAALMDTIGLGGLAPLARLALPPFPPALWYPFALALVAAVVWGAIRVAREAPALIGALTGYLLVVTLWPFTPDRFIWIALPWILLIGFTGMADVARRGRAGTIAAATLALCLAAGYLPREATSLATRGFTRTAVGISGTFRGILPSIGAETPEDAVIAVGDEALVYLYTGRRAVPSQLLRVRGRTTELLDAETHARYFCENGVTHVAVTGPGDLAGRVVDALSTRADLAIEPLFRVTDGPSLHRFQCRM